MESESTSEPDFAALYRPTFDNELKEYIGISPRLAFRLWIAACWVADEWREALTDNDHREFLANDLPVIARPYAVGNWLARFVQRVVLAKDSVGNGLLQHEDYCNCTADEVAVHLIIDAAEAYSDEMWAEFAEEENALPAFPASDSDYALAREILIADSDVRLLYDPTHDGIENESSTSWQFLNLHPRDWFISFS